MSDLNRRKFLAGLSIAGIGLVGGGNRCNAQASLDLSESPATNLMKPETHQAIEAGLQYLRDQQNDDGTFGRGGYGRNVAVCSLAGMAFMASPSSSTTAWTRRPNMAASRTPSIVRSSSTA